MDDISNACLSSILNHLLLFSSLLFAHSFLANLGQIDRVWDKLSNSSLNQSTLAPGAY